MEFPSLTPRISELYGASGGAFRVGEADAYAQDLDELECEERALETMVQELVNRPAAVPIGVKFHREGAGSALQQAAAAAGRDSFGSAEMPQDPDMQFMRSSSSEGEEAEEEEEDDLDEDDMEEEEDDLDEDDMEEDDDDEEEETTGRDTIVRGEGQRRDEDSFARDMESGDESMEMEEELPPSSDWQ